MVDLRVEAGERIANGDAAADAWLSRLAERLDPAHHLLGEAPGAVLRRDGDTWRAGPVVGELHLDGGRLAIVHPGPAGKSAGALLAQLWCEGVEGATRHGLPAFATDVPHVGGSLRGRLDVRGSIRLRSAGSSSVASVHRTRDLDNDISRALVAAERVLSRRLGHDRWRTRRVREVLPRLREAVGRRGRLPGLGDLAAIRYTPITRPYRDLAELSVRIVLHDPLVSTAGRGRPQGLLVPLRPADGPGAGR